MTKKKLKPFEEIHFSTNDIALTFGITNAYALKYLKEFNVDYTTRHVSGYKHDMYLWYPKTIFKKCFDNLNKTNKRFETRAKFLSFMKEKQKNKDVWYDKQTTFNAVINAEKNEIKRLDTERKEMEDRLMIERKNKELSGIYNEHWFNSKSKFILHVGETNSGKTYQAIQALKKSKSGQYLAPLRLLAHEIYETLNTEGIKCDLITGEESILNDSLISSRTIEMADLDTEYDCIVIDEAFMIADKQRGKNWMKAILYGKAKEIHIISNIETADLLENILKETNKEYSINRYERKVPLELGAVHFCEDKKNINKNKTIHVFFSRMACLVEKYRLENKGINVSVVYGALPPEIKKKQMESFRNGDTDVLVATDAIAMGLNLPCDNIVFREISKFDGEEVRRLTPTEIKQIGGRAGRFNLADVGYVYGYDKHIHNHVKEGLLNPIKYTTQGYFGVDFNILRGLNGSTIKEKLKLYDKLDFIPDSMKKYITKELSSIYDDLFFKVSRMKDFNKLSIEDAWKLMNIPYDKNYFLLDSYILSVKNNKKYDFPILGERYDYTDIDDYVSLGHAEQMCAIIDSYLNFSHKFPELCDEEDKEYALDYKKQLQESINKYLLNKKLSSIKRCISCQRNIHITNHHAMCDDCFQERRYNNYW